MTDISVVMAVYNAAAALAETMDSILAQEGDFEVIIVDDGSTDATPRILERYERTRVSRNEQNAGITRSLITGCAAARGTYIARHDAGDRSHPDRFRRQQHLLDGNPQLVCVSSTTDFVGPRGEYLYSSRPAPGSLQPVEMIPAGPSHHGSAMFRRDAYERAGGYRAEWYYGQDWDLWYRLGKEGLFQSIDEPLYIARVTPESISGSARAEQLELAKLSYAAMQARSRGEPDAEFVASAAKIRKAPPLGRPGRARGLYFIGEALRRNGDRRGRGYLAEAIRTDPLLWRAWLRYAQTLVTR
jgi:glycosyltransferase involved in cell wall biosynthesis